MQDIKLCREDLYNLINILKQARLDKGIIQRDYGKQWLDTYSEDIARIDLLADKLKMILIGDYNIGEIKI